MRVAHPATQHDCCLRCSSTYPVPATNSLTALSRQMRNGFRRRWQPGTTLSNSCSEWSRVNNTGMCGYSARTLSASGMPPDLLSASMCAISREIWSGLSRTSFRAVGASGASSVWKPCFPKIALTPYRIGSVAHCPPPGLACWNLLKQTGDSIMLLAVQQAP